MEAPGGLTNHLVISGGAAAGRKQERNGRTDGSLTDALAYYYCDYYFYNSKQERFFYAEESVLRSLGEKKRAEWGGAGRSRALPGRNRAGYRAGLKPCTDKKLAQRRVRDGAAHRSLLQSFIDQVQGLLPSSLLFLLCGGFALVPNWRSLSTLSRIFP